jgi:2'-hydroxyisoflavone reductase
VGPGDASLHAVLEACRAAVEGRGQTGAPGARLVWADDGWLKQNDASGWEAFPLAVPGDADDRGFGMVSAARALAKGLRLRPVGDTARGALAWWNAQPAERRARKRPGLDPAREAELVRLWRARSVKP